MGRRKSQTTAATKMVGARLRQQRKKLRLNLEALQDVVEPSHLAAIERGEVSPTVDTLSGLAKALRTNLGDLVEEGIYQTARELGEVEFAADFAKELPALSDEAQEAFRKILEGAVALAMMSKEKE